MTRLRAHLTWCLVRTTAACAVLAISTPLHAQGTPIRGNVVDGAGARVAGSLVVALDERGQLVARALSGGDGAYTLAMPTSAKVSVHALRVGYEPSDAVQVDAPSSAPLRLTLSSVRTRVSNEKSRQKSVCGTPHDTTSDVTRLWEEARKVIASTRLTFGATPLSAHVIGFDRRTSRDGKSVIAERTHENDVSAHRPFSSLPPDSIANAGYVIESESDVAYYAPDAEVLLSGRFADSHCFGVQSPPSAHPEWIGLSFKPSKDRLGVKEIGGTFWFDRESLELRQLDYRYTNVPTAYLAAGVGGAISFRLMPFGAWIISAWEIRMPQGQIQSQIALQHSQVRDRKMVTVDALRVAGGVVRTITNGSTVVDVK